MRLSLAFASASLFVSLARGHGAITAVKGANGVTAAGFGIDASTPRDGTRARPFQQDTSIIRDDEIASGEASACGRTRLNGVNDIASNLEAATAAGLPSVNADGDVEMTLHQVNGDGAGPYTCAVNTDGTGQDFQPMQVVQQVPGRNSRSRARAQDFPLVARMPAGTACTGGPDGNACIVRCRNGARAGPFGGCVAVTMAEAASAAGNSTEATGNADAKAATGNADAKAATGNADAQAATGNADAQAATGNSDAKAAAQEAEATEAAQDEADAASDNAATSKAGSGSLLGNLFGGNGGAGGLAGILGGIGGARRDSTERKRVVRSRIVRRDLAGRWI